MAIFRKIDSIFPENYTEVIQTVPISFVAFEKLPKSFLALFFSFFSALFLLLTFSLHILSGCCKKLVLIMAKA